MTEDKKETDRHRNRSMACRPSDAMREVIEQLAEDERRRPAQMLLVLIEDALVARGLWNQGKPVKQSGKKPPAGQGEK